MPKNYLTPAARRKQSRLRHLPKMKGRPRTEAEQRELMCLDLKSTFEPDKGKDGNAYSNGERAERGADMVKLHPDANLSGNGCGDVASDCIADLLHYLHREGVDAEKSVQTALMHYQHEC